MHHQLQEHAACSQSAKLARRCQRSERALLCHSCDFQAAAEQPLLPIRVAYSLLAYPDL